MDSKILTPDEYYALNTRFFHREVPGSLVRLLRLTSAESDGIPTGKELVGYLTSKLALQNRVIMVVLKDGSKDHFDTEPIILAQSTDMERLILRSAKETYLLELVFP